MAKPIPASSDIYSESISTYKGTIMNNGAHGIANSHAGSAGGAVAQTIHTNVNKPKYVAPHTLIENIERRYKIS